MRWPSCCVDHPIKSPSRAPNNTSTISCSRVGEIVRFRLQCDGVAPMASSLTGYPEMRQAPPERSNCLKSFRNWCTPVSYTHLRAHETPEHLVCRLLLE